MIDDQVIIGTILTFVVTYVLLKVLKYKKVDSNRAHVTESEEWLKHKLKR